ncbi:MAG: gamma-glutamyl-phosphate reductase, partial [Candidatus Latescibacteria bacterium]|nr:gamma-glutamyl-phosphate reductase [Candidatus Latescibacterota bacterium]
MDITTHVFEKAKKAKNAAVKMACIESAQKNRALRAMADALIDNKHAVREANEKDLAKADDYGLTGAMIDRLTLTDARIEAMANGLREIALLPDPVGKITNM